MRRLLKIALAFVRKQLLAVLVSGGVIAVVVGFFLTQAVKPVASLRTEVTLDQLAKGTNSNSVVHFVSVGNNGDLVLRNTVISITFSPTSAKATIRGPALSARPNKILDESRSRWVTESSLYELQVPNLAPDSEISLVFNSDQPLSVKLEALGEEVQISRVYECELGLTCQLH